MAKNKPHDESNGLEDNSTETHTIVLGGGKLDKLKKFLTNKYINEDRREVLRSATVVDGRTLDVSFTLDTPQGTKVTTDSCPGTVHPDLIAAFSELHEHLGRLCFQPISEHNPLHKNDPTQPALICNIHCTGFSLKGSEDKEKITLTGYRTLPNAKDIKLVSPAQLWDGDIFEYEHISELSETIMRCTGEVMLYLFPSKEWPNCKFAPELQGSFDFPEESVIE
jgi:hypothetical protein